MLWWKSLIVPKRLLMIAEALMKINAKVKELNF
jgi:hypothetical protein